MTFHAILSIAASSCPGKVPWGPHCGPPILSPSPRPRTHRPKTHLLPACSRMRAPSGLKLTQSVALNSNSGSSPSAPCSAARLEPQQQGLRVPANHGAEPCQDSLVVERWQAANEHVNVAHLHQKPPCCWRSSFRQRCSLSREGTPSAAVRLYPTSAAVVANAFCTKWDILGGG